MQQALAQKVSSKVGFKVGDKAVYPAQGVAEVISIEEKDIAGQRQQFYVLRILDTNRKIMVPVANAKIIAERIPRAQLSVVERAGHLLLWDEPERVAPQIGQFVGWG